MDNATDNKKIIAELKELEELAAKRPELEKKIQDNYNRAKALLAHSK